MQDSREDNTAERLVEFGEHLGVNGRHRLAALAFATAAGGTSGASPSLRADALYFAAFHLLEHATKEPEHEAAEEGLLRARSLIQKALLLAKTLPDGFVRTMRLYALLERVLTTQNDKAGATKSCKLALGEMRKAAQRGDVVWDWWVYFRTRQVRAAPGTKEALALATNAANLCRRRGDRVSAAAFHLIAAQIHLVYSTAESTHVSIQAADEDLKAVPLDVLPDAAPLRTAYVLLAGFAMLRIGHTAQVRVEVAKRASDYYDLLERGTAEDVVPAAGSCSWAWLPKPVMNALLQHLLACAYRTSDNQDAAFVNAERALKAASIELGGGQVLSRCINARAGRALAVALLESAARLKLQVVDLKGAYPLVKEVLERAENDGTDGVLDVAKASALLLGAEYYSLSGSLEHARMAMEYLEVIEKAGERDEELRQKFGDILAMARTHRSLLTGNGRVGEVEGKEVFVAKQVHAAALFADGVFHMRASRLIDAKAALQQVLTLCGEGAAANEQIICSTLIVHAGLYVFYESIPEAAHAPALDACHIADRAKDLVNIVRARRQRYKLLAKAYPGKPVVTGALTITKKAVSDLSAAQGHFRPLN